MKINTEEFRPITITIENIGELVFLTRLTQLLPNEIYQKFHFNSSLMHSKLLAQVESYTESTVYQNSSRLFTKLD